MSTFGRLLRITTFGQSHSPMTGCVVDGFPSNFLLSLESIQYQLNRRRPGQSSISTLREEKDRVECVSGMENGRTLGSPLCFLVKNENIKKQDYDRFANVPRPGHADFTYLSKYGIQASSGGGRSSARETIGRVIAGACAKQYLRTQNISLASWVYSAGDHLIPIQVNEQFIKQRLSNQRIEQLGLIRPYQAGYLFEDEAYFNQQSVRESLPNKCELSSLPVLANMRCPHHETALKIYHQIKETKAQQNSIGGIVQGCIYGMPPGIGEPVFDKIQALLAHAMLSIPATKGFQFGSGFQGTAMTGSQHNDLFDSNLQLKSNHSGGSLGGITTGSTFHFKVAFKPVSTIGVPQETCDYDGKPVILEGKGRHDPCVVPRAPPIVDNMAALVVMDLLLSDRSRDR